jgi:hypothetical protein
VGLRYPQRPEPVAAATREQVTTLLAAAEDDRDRILLLMLSVLGLRPGQIVALRTEQINLAERALFMPHKQPGTCVAIAIPDELAAPLERALREDEGREYLFSSDRHPDRPVTVRALQKRLTRIAARCGQEVTCTALRKAESIRQPDGNGRDQTGPATSEPPSPDGDSHVTPARVLISVSVILKEAMHSLSSRPRNQKSTTPHTSHAPETPPPHQSALMPLADRAPCGPAA